MMSTTNRPSTRRQKVHGVYCIESDWWQAPDVASVRPVMEMLQQWSPFHVPFVHRDVATRDEFEHYLKEWSSAKCNKFPILYIALHGTNGSVSFGDGRKPSNSVGLNEIGESLYGRCHGRVIHFGSCDTVSIHGHTLKKFLRNTGALCVSGYGDSLNWMEASALDLLWFAALQGHAMARNGVVASEKELNRSSKSLMIRGEMKIVRSP